MMFDPDVDEDSILQEIPTSEDSEDDVPTSSSSKSNPKEIKDLVHVKLSQLHSMISDDEGDGAVSPIGSPPAEFSVLGGRDTFLALKRKLQEDQAKTQNQEQVQPVQVADVQSLLESFRVDRDQTRSTLSKIEANPRFLELYQQVKDRDHKIIDLEAKLMEKSRQLIDVEDNLMQKEKLLTSKNEAVSVVQRKFEAELSLKQQDLEKSQKVLFEMERNLGKIQDQWKDDKNRLTAEVNKWSERINSLEELKKEAESARFEAVTELAEVKQQLVELQLNNDNLVASKTKLEEEVSNLKNAAATDAHEAEDIRRQQEALDEERTSLAERKHELETQQAEFEEERLTFYREKETFGTTIEEFDEEKSKYEDSKLEWEVQKELFENEKSAFETERYKFIADKFKVEEVLSQKTAENDTLKETVEKYQTNMKKMKAQFQAKLKSLKEEKARDGTTDANVEVLEAQIAELQAKVTALANKNTELEDEKGSLLLRLEAIDEHQDIAALQEKLTADQDAMMKDRLTLEIDIESLNDDRARLESDMEQFEREKADWHNNQKSSQEELSSYKDSLLQEVSDAKENLKIERDRFYAEVQENKENLERERQIIVKQLDEIAAQREQLTEEKAAAMNLQRDLEVQWEKFHAEKAAFVQERETTKQLLDASYTSVPGTPSAFNTSFVTENAQSEGAGAILEVSSDRESILQAQIDDLTKKLEIAQANVKKLKLQYQAKLKQIKAEYKGKSDAGSATASPIPDTTALENKLTELEEEKGNFLLRLVDYEELQANHERLKSEMEMLKSTLQTKDIEIATLTEDKPSSYVPADQENVVIQQLVKSLEQSNEAVSQHSSELSQMSVQKVEHQSRIQLLTQEIAVLENALSEKTEQIQSLEEQVEFTREDFTNAVKDFDGAISKKNEEIDTLKSHLANVINLPDNDGQIQELQSALDAKTHEVQQLQEQLMASEQVSTNDAKLEELQTVIQTKTSELESLQRQMMKKSELIAELEDDLSAKIDQMQELRAKLDENAHRMQELEAQTAKHVQSSEEGQGWSSWDEPAESAMTGTLLEDLKSEIMKLQEENTKLHTQLAKKSSSNQDTAWSAWSEDAEPVVDSARELEELRLAISQHQQEIKDLKEQLSKSKEKTTDKGWSAWSEETDPFASDNTAEEEDLKSTITRLQAEINMLGDQNTRRAEESEQEAKARSTWGDDEVDSVRTENAAEIADLKLTLAKFQDEIHDLRNQLQRKAQQKPTNKAWSDWRDEAEASQDNSALVEELQETISKLQSEIELLRIGNLHSCDPAEIERMQQELSELTEEKNTEIMRLTTELAQANQLFNARSEELNSKSGEYDQMKGQHVQLYSDLKELIRSLADSEKTISQNTLQVMDLNQSLEVSKAESLHLSAIVNELLLQVQLKMDVLAETNSRCLELQSALDAAKRELVQATATSDWETDQELITLRQDVKHKTSELASVNEQLDSTKAKLRNAQEELEAFQQKAQDLEVQTNQLETMKLDYADLKDQLADKDEELEFTLNEMVQLRSQMDELKKKASHDNEQIAEIDYLKGQLSEASSQLANISQQLSEKEHQLQELQNQRVTAENGLSEAILKIQSLENQVAHYASASGDVEELKRQLLEKDEELDLSVTELCNARSANKDLTGQVDALQLEINTLKQQLDETMSAKHMANQQLQNTLIDIDQRDQHILELQQQLHALQTSAASKDESVGSLRSECQELQQRLSIAAAELNAANERLSSMVSDGESSDVLLSRIASLQSQLSDKDTELESTVQEILELRSKCKELQLSTNQSSEYQATIEDLQAQLLEKDEELEFTNNQIMTLSSKSGQVDKLTKQLQDTQAELANKTAEYTEQVELAETLQNELANLKFVQSRSENEVSELRATIQDLESKLTAKTEELEFTAEEMNKLRSTLDEVETDVLKNVQDREDGMQRHLQDLQACINDKDEEIRRIMAQYDDYYNVARLELETKHKALEAMEQALAEKTELVSGLEVQLQEERKRVQSLNVQHEQQQQQVQQAPPQQPALFTPAPANMFGAPDPSNFFDTFGAAAQVPAVEPALRVAHVTPVGEAPQPDALSKDQQLYEQEVQITEMSITIEELRSQIEDMQNQLAEVDYLRNSVKSLQEENEKLQQHVRTAVSEREEIQNERAKKIASFLDMEEISGTKDYQPKPGALPVEEPAVVTSDAFKTSDVEDLTRKLNAKDTQIAALNQELKELKVKSGKVLQKLRQTTTKYDELTKKHEALKTKSEFSLESAFEDEVQNQITKKDAVIQELQAEKHKLQAQVDMFERSQDKLVDSKESTDALVNELQLQKRALEYEISGLKWKIEELENARAATPGGEPTFVPGGAEEIEGLRAQNTALVQEITTLQAEIGQQREVVTNLHNQLQQAYYQQQAPAQLVHNIQDLTQFQQPQNTGEEPPLSPILSPPTGPVIAPELLEEERLERDILQRKIELLQNKIAELEQNESKYYEDLQKTKVHAQMLDMENLQYQEIIGELNKRLSSTDKDNVKSKILQDEVSRLILALDEKDNSKYAEIASEIFKLQEEKAQLEYRLGELEAKYHAPADLDSLTFSNQEAEDVAFLRVQLSEMERENLALRIDLRRESNARRVVQEQLFFHQIAKSQNHRMGPLVGNSLSTSLSSAKRHSTSSSPSRHSPLPMIPVSPAPPGGRSTPKPIADTSVTSPS